MDVPFEVRDLKRYIMRILHGRSFLIHFLRIFMRTFFLSPWTSRVYICIYICICIYMNINDGNNFTVDNQFDMNLAGV